MRTISADNDAILTQAGGRKTLLRVDVKDSGGTDRDLTTYPGENLVLGAQWGETVDSPGMSGTIKLKREVELLSLAPLMDSSPLNRAFNPAASPVPLLACKREVKIYTAIQPGDAGAAPSWVLQFHGKIDAINWGNGEEVELKVSDLQGDLRDLFIEKERVYAHANPADGDSTKGLLIYENSTAYALNDLLFPTKANRNGHFYKVTTAGTSGSSEPTWPTGGGATVASGSAVFTEVGTTTMATGTAVETVMQQLLTDNGSGVTLSTPSSPSWLILSYIQNRVSLWDALRQLVDQIGWDLRYKWDSGSSSFKLTFYAPDRAKTTPDRTFSKSEKLELSRLEVDVADVRNVIRIVYSDSAILDAENNPIRAYLEVSDSGSITAFGRRFMEIAESSSSNIDTSAEAAVMANAAKADLATPVAEQEVLFEYFPFVELGDLYRFSGDGLFHSGNLDLAVTGYQHSIDTQGATTSLSCRGKPSGGVDRWLSRAAEINPEDSHQLNLFNGTGLTINTSDVVGGTKLTATSNLDKKALAQEYEFHVSTSSGFTPSSATLVKVGQTNECVAPNLIPGTSYYTKVIPRARNATRIVRGLPSAEVSFVAGRASSGHMNEGIALGDYPLNGGFETRLNTGGMPDHWYVNAGSYGSDVTVKEDGSGLSGNRYIRLSPSSNVEVGSAKIPIVNEGSESNRESGLYRFTVWVKNAASNNAANTLEVFLRGFDYQGSLQTALTSLVLNAASKTGHWQRLEQIIRVDADVDIRSIDCVIHAPVTSGQFIVDIDEVRCQYLGTPWYDVGDTSNYTDNYESIPGFNTGYSNYDASNHTKAQFRKNQHGHVWVRGLVKHSTTTTINTTIFTLPVGYRPAKRLHYLSVANGQQGVLEVASNGDVIFTSAQNANPSTYLSLDCINFETHE